MISTARRELGFAPADVNSRDFAREQLFGSRVTSASSLEGFNNNHNTTAFNAIMQSSYAQKAVVETPAQPQFASYVSPAPTYTNPLTQAPVATSQAVETPQAQPIFNPYSSPYFEPKNEIKWELEINPETNTVAAEKKQSGTAEIISAKLNSRGILMAATYALVVVLLAVLLIINTVNIRANDANIRNYEAQIANLASGIGALEASRNEAMNQDRLEGLAAEAGFTDEVNKVYVQTPPVNATPSRASTNWFDQIVKFFQRLFGAA